MSHSNLQNCPYGFKLSSQILFGLLSQSNRDVELTEVPNIHQDSSWEKCALTSIYPSKVTFWKIWDCPGLSCLIRLLSHGTMLPHVHHVLITHSLQPAQRAWPLCSPLIVWRKEAPSFLYNVLASPLSTVGMIHIYEFHSTWKSIQ